MGRLARKILAWRISRRPRQKKDDPMPIHRELRGWAELDIQMALEMLRHNGMR